MNFSLKKRIGALLIDGPRYIYYLARAHFGAGHEWLFVKNRNQQLELSNDPFGIKCRWLWTSDLYLPKVFPAVGQLLFSKALNTFSFKLQSNRPNSDIAPDVSFIIGHRGSARTQLLLKTIESIAAQQHCNIECIIVEQDSEQIVRPHLPAWVKYVFTPTDDPSMSYSRSWAFNVGAEHANSDCLIFHDNDLLVPTDYAFLTLQLMKKGFEFINLKRFIFYLSESATQDMLNTMRISSNLKIESIMQNAEGGGSIGASKKAYFTIGGFDQRFLGWGGEDNEFWERAQTQSVWPYGSLALIHLWHGPQKEKLDKENATTIILYNTLSKHNPLERIKWLQENQLRGSKNNISVNTERD
jgi:hypothetical protein